MRDKLFDAIAAEIGRQAAATHAWYRPPRGAEPPAGYDQAKEGPWIPSDMVSYHGRLDLEALCRAIR
ncbi:MAG TPA: hypothetical protein VEB21_20625, partial [Terriglobales bacterium]|nr:hypothetical protein [Terriglobales bacterium]